jgi:hypothetical protein
MALSPGVLVLIVTGGIFIFKTLKLTLDFQDSYYSIGFFTCIISKSSCSFRFFFWY